MICLVTCIIVFSNIGHYDTCQKEVELIYETSSKYYVKVKSETPKVKGGSVQIEFPGEVQQISKLQCRR
jgi:hypothetical protein